MNGFLINRSNGEPPHILRSAQLTRLHFALGLNTNRKFPQKHHAAVNSLSIERSESRYLLSGGGESAIYVWDLHVPLNREVTIFKCLAQIPAVKVWDTASMSEASSFNLDCNVYSHDVSPVAAHALVATAAGAPYIRLCDLKSGGFTHSLAGHHGKVITIRWSPRKEYVLASGGTDGTIRIWDIRRAASCLVSLDSLNSGNSNLAETNIAHHGTVNGISWTDDSVFLVSTGHDEKMRVWDMDTGMNTLVNFGPQLRNKSQQVLNPWVTGYQDAGCALVFHPCDDGVIRLYDLHSGNPISVLRSTPNQRVTSVVNRPGHVQYYSGSNDRNIHVWSPQLSPAKVESKNTETTNVLNDIYQTVVHPHEEVRFT